MTEGRGFASDNTQSRKQKQCDLQALAAVNTPNPASNIASPDLLLGWRANNGTPRGVAPGGTREMGPPQTGDGGVASGFLP